jgi:hypothetical protein
VLIFAVDGVDGENGVLTNVGVSVFKAGSAGWDEGFEEFGVLGYFLKETECCTTNVLVRVLLKDELKVVRAGMQQFCTKSLRMALLHAFGVRAFS